MIEIEVEILQPLDTAQTFSIDFVSSFGNPLEKFAIPLC